MVSIVLHILLYVGALLLGAFVGWICLSVFNYFHVKRLKANAPFENEELATTGKPFVQTEKEVLDNERRESDKLREFERIRRIADQTTKPNVGAKQDREFNTPSIAELPERTNLPVRLDTVVKQPELTNAGYERTIKDAVTEPKRKPKSIDLSG